MPLVEDTGLDGPHHGQADGRAWKEAEAAFGGAPHTYPEQPYAFGPDSWNSYLIRATRYLTGLLERNEGQRVLLVAHGKPSTPPATSSSR
ncbi:histidine phosphatase family protein [Streptomyces sp. NPDC006197]|uniref:histidine phosphatase family protein n=1 Tax=Streptomyces sp. NPDC006197 TaxID=3156685 RepID=UPI0033B43912